MNLSNVVAWWLAYVYFLPSLEVCNVDQTVHNNLNTFSAHLMKLLSELISVHSTITILSVVMKLPSEYTINCR
jgi:hypothetical protein